MPAFLWATKRPPLEAQTGEANRAAVDDGRA